MAIREGSFYPVFPILDGTPMSRQWGISRSNTAELKAIARNSYQELEADQDELNALRALIGQAYGDLDFRNRFRFAYDSDTDELLCQSNIGTVDDPEWSDAWQVRFHDNQVQIVGDGGIYSSHGFYSGDDTLQSIKEVAEVGDDAETSILNPIKLFFDRDAGLTVTRITSGSNAGHPEISVDRPFGQAQLFEKRGRVWQVDHNFGITPVLAQVMDSGYRIVIPDKADLSNPNTAYFYFNEVFSGSVYIASGGVGAASLAPRDPFYLVMRTDEMSAADNTIKNNADLIFDSGYFYINVDLDTDRAGAHKTAHISLTDTVTDDSEYAFRDGSRSFTDHVDFDDSVYVENAVTAEAFYTKADGEVAPLTVEESDGSPSVSNVNKIIVSGTGILTDDGDGQVTVSVTGVATDHGTLVGLTDDDHTQYALADGSRDFSGHVNFNDTIYVENAVTAEAFYTKSGSEVITYDDLSLKNVKDYGAKGDNTHDDTSAIQNAIDDVIAAGGGIVYFPAGNYYISSTLTFAPHYLTHAIKLQGAGCTTTYLRMKTVDLPLINVQGTYTKDGSGKELASWTIRNLAITTDASPYTDTETPAILVGTAAKYISGYARSLIEDVHVNNFPVGIEIFNARQIDIRAFSFLNSTSGIYGVYLHQEEGASNFTGDITFRACDLQTSGSGSPIKMYGTGTGSEVRGLRFSDCVFYSGSPNVYMLANDSAQVGSTVFCNCDFEAQAASTNYGLQFSATNSGRTYQTLVSNCRFVGQPTAGVYSSISNSGVVYSIVINGCVMSWIEGDAINLSDTKAFVLSDLTLSRMHKDQGASGAAIVIGSGCTNFVIDSISHIDIESSPPEINYIVSVDSTCTDYKVRNLIGDFAVGPLSGSSGPINTHVSMSDTLYVENAVTAEAFYLKTGGGLTRDHGELNGLTDDDHTQYSLVNGTRNFTGDVTLKNSADADLSLSIDSGSTTAQRSFLRFADQGSNKWSLYKHSVGNDFVVWNHTTSASAIYIDSDNSNIGLGGTTSPVAKLHVNGDLRVDDTIYAENAVTAEAFYVKSLGEVPVSYVEEFDSAVEWEVNHNLNRPHFIAQTFKGTGEMLTPDAVYVNDQNTAYFYFTEAHAGKAVILAIG